MIHSSQSVAALLSTSAAAVVILYRDSLVKFVVTVSYSYLQYNLIIHVDVGKPALC